MIPGINLLNIALGAIQAQGTAGDMLWFKFAGNTVSDSGRQIPVFDEGLPIIGSFQPTEARVIQQLGLEMQKTYRTLITSNPIDSLKRENSPDYLTYLGRKYSVAGDRDWYFQDGWKRIFFVDIGPA